MSEVVTLGTPIIVAFITVAGGVLSLWLKYKLDTIARSAGLAADRSAPTSNGFAATVLGTLARIESRQDTQDGRLDDLTAAFITHLQEGKRP